MMSTFTTTTIQQHDYDSLYHLAEVSVFKLNPPEKPRTEPTLRRQLLVRNLLILSSNLIITNNQDEELWLDSCFDQLTQEDQDYLMEEEEEELKPQNDKKDDLLVVAIPFKLSITKY